MPIQIVRRLSAAEPSNWPPELTQSATFTCLDSWLEVAGQIYQVPIYRFETEIEGVVTGLLALAHIQHPIFGNYLVTSPFGSYGGFAYDSLAARDQLLDAAHSLASELGAQYVALRFKAGETPPSTGWVQQPLYQTYWLDLAPGIEALMAAFHSDHRNHIRKALKKGFTLQFGHLNLLDQTYETLVQAMRELGSPYHSKAYLQKMAENLGSTLDFAVLYDPQGTLAGAGVFIAHGKTVTNLHANILSRVRSDYAGEFFYWKAIEHYSQQGFQILDLGRSLIGSGNETFKMKWKPQQHSLAYWYALKPGTALPTLHQKNPTFQFFIWLWKRLPTFVVRWLGPFIIRGLA